MMRQTLDFSFEAISAEFETPSEFYLTPIHHYTNFSKPNRKNRDRIMKHHRYTWWKKKKKERKRGKPHVIYN